MVVCGKECGLVWMTYGFTKLSHTSVLERQREREEREAESDENEPAQGVGEVHIATQCQSYTGLAWIIRVTGLFFPLQAVFALLFYFFSDLSMDFKSLWCKLTSFSADLKIIMLLRGWIIGWKFKEGALLCFALLLRDQIFNKCVDQWRTTLAISLVNMISCSSSD